MDDRAGDAQWPHEIARLQSAVQATGPGTARDHLRGRLWRLLFEALMRFLRIHDRHSHSTACADLEDIAAAKALEILSRAESGAWDSSGRSAAEISGYLSSAARFGWIDHIQRRTREVRIPDDAGAESLLEHDATGTASSPESPTVSAEARELADALRACVERLPDRERRVWFYRAYYEMSSREIAVHPQVRLNAPHVDVVLQRTRGALRDCMRGKGHELTDLPAGAFVDLWEMLATMADQEAPGNGGRDWRIP
jgi:RNA polymerase sigma factor (sigma-70 family)